jgi:hypothetical protein
MIQILFEDLRNGNLVIEATQIEGLTSYNIGDILYADDTDSLTTLAIGTANQVLQVNSGADAPEWGLVDFDNMTPAASASTLIGRRSGSTGNWEAVTLGTGLSMSAGAVLSGSASGSTYTYITSTDQTGDLPNSRHLLAGTNITLDISVAGDITVSAAGTAPAGSNGDVQYNNSGAFGGRAIAQFGYWSPLTNGIPGAPELIFDGNGDTVAIWTSTI